MGLRYLFVTLAVVLSACDGEQAAQNTCTAPTPVTVQLFGDSTQTGYGVSPSSSPPVLLQRAMDARFGPGAVHVEGRGVAGTTSGDLVSSSDGLNQWPASATAHIVVVNHGINDMSHGTPLAEYADNLRQLDATVYETPNPVLGFWYDPAYSETMRTVAKERGAVIADVDELMRTKDFSTLTNDLIHPNAKGYEVIVDEVLMPTLVPLVKEWRCES